MKARANTQKTSWQWRWTFYRRLLGTKSCQQQGCSIQVLENEWRKEEWYNHISRIDIKRLQRQVTGEDGGIIYMTLDRIDWKPLKKKIKAGYTIVYIIFYAENDIIQRDSVC